MSQDAGDLAKLFSRMGLFCVMTIVPPLVAGCTAVKDKRSNPQMMLGSESGGSAPGPSGNAGSGAGTTRWFCMNVAESCACVETAGETSRCSVTPPCCFSLTMVGLDTCQCWPENSEPCRDLRAGSPDKKAIRACPP